MSATTVIEHKARRNAARMRLRAATELRQAARLLAEDALALEQGQPPHGGHQRDAAKAIQTARDYIAGATILVEFADDIDRS